MIPNSDSIHAHYGICCLFEIPITLYLSELPKRRIIIKVVEVFENKFLVQIDPIDLHLDYALSLIQKKSVAFMKYKGQGLILYRRIQSNSTEGKINTT